MIYFDHAATGLPKSEGVINAVVSGMQYFGNAGRGLYDHSTAADRAVFNCRNNLAKLFNTTPENCILTKSCTEALNIAVKGFITAKKGKIGIITSDYNHNAVTRIFYDKSIKEKINLKTFKCDLFNDKKTTENFKNALSEDISLAVLTHASNVCGRIFPVKEMVSAAREKGITVITDVAQTVGHENITAGEYGDILCLPGHKGLYGPVGTGSMVIAKGFKTPLSPLLHGGTGIMSVDKKMPLIYPERFEAGTLNAPAYAGLATAIYESKESDKKTSQKIFKYLLAELKNMKNITVIGAPEVGNENKWVPIILFNVWGHDCETVSEMLAKENFALRAGLHCAPDAHAALGSIKTGGVRLSIGRGNTMVQAKGLIDTLARKVAR